MSRNKYYLNLKVNTLGSRIVKVNSHTASESLTVHIILLIVTGFLTFTAYNSGEIEFMYIGLVITALFLLIVVVDIYFVISYHITKSDQTESEESP
ncbi:hypothetical protein DFR28_11085 [Arenicella xantha]|uniref:Uncharacterized protein n=1 Tax=Arenicella xantha TaxID=644221 RepID=A0A395JEZ9_9GAMM|nr:hypothetical protein DFR28_11085 [Arenicella xantha]